MATTIFMYVGAILFVLFILYMIGFIVFLDGDVDHWTDHLKAIGATLLLFLFIGVALIFFFGGLYLVVWVAKDLFG